MVHRMRIIDKYRPQVVVDGDRLLERIGVDSEGVVDASPGFQRVLDDSRYVPVPASASPLRRNVRRLFARSILWVRRGRFRIGSPLVCRSRMTLWLDGITFSTSIAPLGESADWPRAVLGM